jgi:hypothetical protein
MPTGTPSPRTRRPSRRLGAAVALLGLAVSLGGCLQMATRPTAPPPPTPTPSPTPLPTPTPTPGPPTPTPVPTFATYTVRAGDSLTTIARRYHTTARSIAYWNRDTYHSLDPESPHYAPDNLQIGWVLRVQPGVVFSPSPTPEPIDSGLEVTPRPTEYLGPPTESPSEAPSGSPSGGATLSGAPSPSAG